MKMSTQRRPLEMIKKELSIIFFIHTSYIMIRLIIPAFLNINMNTVVFQVQTSAPITAWERKSFYGIMTTDRPTERVIGKFQFQKNSNQSIINLIIKSSEFRMIPF